MSRLGLDPFLLGLIGAVSLAVVFPRLGQTGGLLHIDVYTSYGIAVVFLLYGLTLSWARLKAGLLNWRLHVLIQGSTFLVFPLLVWALAGLIGRHLPADLKLGFFYLAAAPSTISSSVIMTSIARGNVAGAVFNASLSSLIGVLATPLWVDWYLSFSGHSLALGPVVVKILSLVLAPIVVGQLIRPFLADWLAGHLALTRFLDRTTILAIVFNAFADSMGQGVWQGRGVEMLATLTAGSLGLFFAVFFLLVGLCRLLGFSHADTVAGVFCGSKKSIAAGVPMAKVMFGATPLLGVVIAPIMLYHVLQLLAAGFIARRWAARGA